MTVSGKVCAGRRGPLGYILRSVKDRCDALWAMKVEVRDDCSPGGEGGVRWKMVALGGG